MSLIVWLPLNGNLNNQGLSNITVTNNGATVNDNGKIGKCYEFNPSNSSSGQNYLRLSAKLSDILPSGHSFTYMCWIKLTGNLYSNGCGLITSNAYKQTGIGLYLHSSKKLFIQMCYGDTEQEWVASRMTPFQNDIWYHVAFTYNEINQQIIIYINGIQVDSNIATDIWQTRNSYILIGNGTQGGWQYTLPGYMNDVRIYDHCLSPKEVHEISKGLVLHYKLDEINNSSIESTINLLSNTNLTWGQLTVQTSYTKNGDKYIVTIGNLINNNTYGTSRLYIPLSVLQNNKQYSISFKYRVISGTGLIDINGCDWSDMLFISKKETINGEYHYIELVCPIRNYNSTYHFMDFRWTEPNTIFEISNIQLEENDHATPYVNGSRNLEETINLLDYSNLQGHGSSWTLQNTTFCGYVVYKNIVTNPSASNNAGFSIRNQITNSNIANTTKLTLSFYKKLNTVYGKNLGGYIRVIRSDDSESVYYWSYNKSNWANDSNSIGIWEYIYSTVTIPSGCKAIKHCYVYTDGATGGDCDFAGIQLELKDHATPYVNGIRETPGINNIVYDSSGYKNHGNITGTLTIDNNSPKYNYYTYFDGTSYIKSNNLNLNETSNFTISCWVNITNSQSYQPIFWLGNGITAQGICAHGPRGSRIEGGNDTNDFDTSLANIDLNSWKHIVITYDGITIKRYINGELNGTISFSYKFGNTFVRMYIGYFWAGRYKGNISDFRLYMTTLSESDIKELYDTPTFIDNQGNLLSGEFDEENTEFEVLKNGISKINKFIEITDYIYLPAGTYINTELNYANNDVCKAETVIRYESGGSGRDLMGYSPSGSGYWGVTSAGAWEPHGTTFTYTNSDITQKNTIVYIFSSASEHGIYRVGALGSSYSVRGKYIYRVRLYKNSILERDLYPIKVGDKVGLFDILHNTYYLANNTNGTINNDGVIELNLFQNKIEVNQLLEI